MTFPVDREWYADKDEDEPAPVPSPGGSIDVVAYNERTWRDIQSRTIAQKHRPASMDGFTYGAALVALEKAIDEALTVGLAAGRARGIEECAELVNKALRAQRNAMVMQDMAITIAHQSRIDTLAWVADAIAKETGHEES